ncbi:MAG: apolipoprotein N-acyltransferase [Actinobacteria bacterium]|nr:apolipoprotein N-acyltransferase [Actinomycetota bacterium]
MTRGARPLLAAAAAVAAGLSIVVAQPPLGWWPTTFLAAPLLLLAVATETDLPEGTRPRAFRWGLLAGVAAYAPMLAWLVRPAGYLGWVLLVLIQAAFLGLLAVLLRPVVRTPWVVLAAPVLWAGMDAWRGVFPLGGFEWGSIAYAAVEGSWMLPLARLVGGRGITVLTVLVGALAFEAGRRVHAAVTAVPTGGSVEQLRDGLPAAQRPLVGLAVALLVSVLATIEPPATTGESLDVLVVQGNDELDRTELTAREVDRDIAATMRELTVAAVDAGDTPDLTVWPESSVDRDAFGERGADLLPEVEVAAEATDGNLLVGVNRDGDVEGTFLNSAVLVDAAGDPVDAYVKRQIVPFGEYVPFRAALGWFPPLRQIPRDAVRGERAAGVTVDDVRVAVVICFETLFPDLVRQNVVADGEDAALVVSTTNDASFGRSAEPAQHLAQSRLRAVETGRWVVHAALSGASAFVSPAGEVFDQTGVFELTTIRRDVPLVAGRTPFLATGDVLGAAVRLATAVWLLVLLARAWRTRTRSPEPHPERP